MTLNVRRLTLYIAAAIPFVLVPAILAWSVVPIARTGARWCHVAFAVLSFPTEATAVAATIEPASDVSPESAAESYANPGEAASVPSAPQFRASNNRPAEAPMARSAAAKGSNIRRTSPNVFVGPESIKRAIPVAGRPTSAWTNRTPEHPAGLLIQSPGALRGVIEPGDILVEAEGRPIGNFEQLVVTVTQAYERRAKRLSGRLFRKGDLVPVTVEPGW
jgi:hypothetical protein